jgi:hypothetical protein
VIVSLGTSKWVLPATHLSRWVHPNGTTKSHPPPSIVKAVMPSQLADTPSSPLPHNHVHLGRAGLGPEANHGWRYYLIAS